MSTVPSMKVKIMGDIGQNNCGCKQKIENKKASNIPKVKNSK